MSMLEERILGELSSNLRRLGASTVDANLDDWTLQDRADGVPEAEPALPSG